MKLFLCLSCQDIQKIIRSKMRTCDCGKCTGVLDKDGITATVTGPCQVLGIGASSVSEAAITQTRVGDEGLKKMESPASKKLRAIRKADPLKALMLAAGLPAGALARETRGRRFLAFVIPYAAGTVLRDKEPSRDFFDHLLP